MQLPSFLNTIHQFMCWFVSLILNNEPFYKNQNDIFSLIVVFFKTIVFDPVSIPISFVAKIFDVHSSMLRSSIRAHKITQNLGEVRIFSARYRISKFASCL